MEDCSCVYIPYDTDESWDDEPTQEMETAKAERVCTECGKIIKFGEHYEYFIGYFCGNLEVYRTCLDCLSLREAFFCKGWVFTMLWEDFEGFVYGCRAEISFAKFSELTQVALHKACAIVDEFWVTSEEDTNELERIQALINMGHYEDCAYRIVWGDGQCMCEKQKGK